jgi:hypothetical protein
LHDAAVPGPIEALFAAPFPGGYRIACGNKVVSRDPKQQLIGRLCGQPPTNKYNSGARFLQLGLTSFVFTVR